MLYVSVRGSRFTLLKRSRSQHEKRRRSIRNLGISEDDANRVGRARRLLPYVKVGRAIFQTAAPHDLHLYVRSRMPARDYEKQGQIGEGTFGTVSKAVHRPTGSVVAIKKIRRIGLSKGQKCRRCARSCCCRSCSTRT